METMEGSHPKYLKWLSILFDMLKDVNSYFIKSLLT